MCGNSISIMQEKSGMLQIQAIIIDEEGVKNTAVNWSKIIGG